MRKIRGQNAYKVFNKLTGKIHSNHSTLANAKKQLNLLERLAKDEELQIAIDNDKTIVRAKKGEKDKDDKLTKIKKNLKEILGEGILDLALGDREATNVGNNPNNQILYYTRKEDEEKQKKYIIDNNRQIVNLPYENEYDYQAPPFVIATNKKKSGYNFKLVNPVSKERNLASRKGENVIGLDRRAIPVPAIFHRDKEGRLQRPELRDFSPEDREILKKYDDLINRYEEQFNEGDFEEIPEIPFSNSERGRPCKLPKNCRKGIKKGKQGRKDINELTPTEADKRAKKPLEPTTPYLRTTPMPRRSGREYNRAIQEDRSIRQPEVFKHNQERLEKKKKPLPFIIEEDEPEYPLEEAEEEVVVEKPKAKKPLRIVGETPFEDFGLRVNKADKLAPLIEYIKMSEGKFENWDRVDAYIKQVKNRKIKTPEGYKELVALAKKEVRKKPLIIEEDDEEEDLFDELIRLGSEKKGKGIKKKISSNSIMPKFAKGSQEAKDHMASIRANRGAKVAKPVSSKIGGGFINYLPASSNSQSQIANAYNDSELGANGGRNYISL